MTKKERSPAYPSMNLEEAIKLLGLFHTSTKGYPVDATDESPVAFKLIGFDKPHGDAKRALAALIAFGLIENVAGASPRKVKTSDLGRRIATYPADDPNRPEWMLEAGLKPKIFGQIVARFPDGLPPSDSPVNSFLLDQGFNPAVTASLIKDFKATAAFAKVFDGIGGTITHTEPEGAENGPKKDDMALQQNHQQGQEPPPPPGQQGQQGQQPPPGMQAVPVVLSLGREFIVQIPEDYSKQDIEDFDEVWDIYRKRLLRQLAAKPSPKDVAPAASRVQPQVRTGPALWRGPEADQPVVVNGYYGETGGRHYARIEGSETGVPMDELVYDAE